ncbi:Gfo/Idh/MocA family protein [Helicobacter canadensis]|uniref:Gfo/Idh/MocA-like oxidoreductase N-terminal domain-containing protein n=1 Tax=Helicobacter canadensis MIT 98-5491 TaxID=537970 RepID=C5ZXN7_9HELI|nr:Gfo/Idh/MocA family oxidoreductase [Helicobacter canadensis]EES89905.1 hypothetical protein HCAN_1195 [Helicobacter canadensis MIT 98-5491]EFR49051.1 oxidoreductase, NAD-binding domain protein [Helicobacter canadensis MIT 98-5491]STP02595.1 oxidoreductase domain-containing protein [Helicobacter canadensis]
MKSIIIGNGHWGNILKKYIEQDCNFSILEIFGRDFSPLKIPKTTQAAFIATPLQSHFKLALECLKLGIHVFVEKPTCKSSKEFDILQSVAEENGVRIYTDYIYLTSPSIIKIRENLSSLNNITSVKATIKQYGKFYDGESALEVLGVHFLSVFVFLFGSLELIEKNNLNPHDNDFLFNSKGITIKLESSLISKIKERTMNITAENGTIAFDMLSADTVKMTINNKDMTFSFDEKNNLVNSLRKFYDILHNKNKYMEHIRLSSNVMKILDECNS